MKYKVILVDDESMILSGLSKLIRWDYLGVELAGTFNDGSEALDYVKTNPVDIVITDVSMPEMNGIDFIANAQQENINFNFIILSGYQEFNYVMEGIKLGAENFILKPIDAQELNKSIEKIVSKLNEEKDKKMGREVLFEDTMLRWLNDEIDPIDLRRILKSFSLKIERDDLFTVIAVGGIVSDRKKTWLELIKNHHIVYYIFDLDVLYLIVNGSNVRFESIKKSITRVIKKPKETFAIGEQYVEYDKIYRSFDHASSLLEISQFYDYEVYGTDENNDLISTINSDKVISFELFQQSLSLGNVENIRAELEHTFQQIVQKNPEPKYVKYMAFIMFSDIYRFYKQLGSKQYKTQLKELHGVKSSHEILDILFEAVEINQERIEVTHYNINVQNALSKIHQFYMEDLSVQSIAADLHLNSMYFGQIFKKETGFSFTQYLNQYRVNKAQELLAYSNHNVNEIAELVGYTSSGYFYKNFKKECGISPSEYREKMRQ